MKRSLFLTFCVLLLSQFSFGQRGPRLKVPTLSPRAETTQSAALTEVKLSYSRPSARGRKIYGGLVPFGEVWRTGANASTKITFSQDVKIEGNALKAGTYALYTIPGATEWTMIIHRNISHRSLAGDVYKQAEDAFRFTSIPETTDDFVETFTIQFANIRTGAIDVVLIWENTRVKFGIEFDVNSQVDRQIAELLKSREQASAGNYFLAAEYYLHNQRDLKKAAGWITSALAKSPKNPRFGLLHAKILFKQGKRDDALRVIAMANAWAKEQNNANYTDQTRVFWDSIR